MARRGRLVRRNRKAADYFLSWHGDRKGWGGEVVFFLSCFTFLEIPRRHTDAQNSREADSGKITWLNATLKPPLVFLTSVTETNLLQESRRQGWMRSGLVPGLTH
ncbi:hypothetical protein PoB_003030100 [Plakobranchus ocellatus]|uniref:Uncharacterized protein n=1 Tax=Plakobranchus ocellatus TaxID=259542 RepID=A0AAV4AAY6_9GAST|nr:hypothetical protein PoB_003030100 [Plakobranchus ocellatus]